MLLLERDGVGRSLVLASREPFSDGKFYHSAILLLARSRGIYGFQKKQVCTLWGIRGDFNWGNRESYRRSHWVDGEREWMALGRWLPAIGAEPSSLWVTASVVRKEGERTCRRQDVTQRTHLQVPQRAAKGFKHMDNTLPPRVQQAGLHP